MPPLAVITSRQTLSYPGKSNVYCHVLLAHSNRSHVPCGRMGGNDRWSSDVFAYFKSPLGEKPGLTQLYTTPVWKTKWNEKLKPSITGSTSLLVFRVRTTKRVGYGLELLENLKRGYWGIASACQRLSLLATKTNSFLVGESNGKDNRCFSSSLKLPRLSSFWSRNISF